MARLDGPITAEDSGRAVNVRGRKTETVVVRYDLTLDPTESIMGAEYLLSVNGTVIRRMSEHQARRLGLVY